MALRYAAACAHLLIATAWPSLPSISSIEASVSSSVSSTVSSAVSSVDSVPHAIDLNARLTRIKAIEAQIPQHAGDLATAVNSGVSESVSAAKATLRADKLMLCKEIHGLGVELGNASAVQAAIHNKVVALKRQMWNLIDGSSADETAQGSSFSATMSIGKELAPLQASLENLGKPISSAQAMFHAYAPRGFCNFTSKESKHKAVTATTLLPPALDSLIEPESTSTKALSSTMPSPWDTENAKKLQAEQKWEVGHPASSFSLLTVLAGLAFVASVAGLLASFATGQFRRRPESASTVSDEEQLLEPAE
eukprot:TRINITY_DN25374_c0_g3_i1.p1 TRINITY_DN25374_c0_g3~~TRINITY_DN25374_c0_g3_i1.p1  ORF type:complete len:308 (-),score=44.97 TRINITY_DN25374_c0_g3_i1:380-1303(-)